MSRRFTLGSSLYNPLAKDQTVRSPHPANRTLSISVQTAQYAKRDMNTHSIEQFNSRLWPAAKQLNLESFVTDIPEKKQCKPINRGMTSSEPSDLYNRHSEPQSSNPMQNEKKYILVIDDETSVREVTAEILREANVHTLEAEDGLIGLELFLKYSKQIVLVLLDFSMPGLNGGQVLEQIWKIDPSVPVLFFSGYGQHETVRRYYRSGAVGFLQKPYTINELLLAVKQNLKRE